MKTTKLFIVASAITAAFFIMAGCAKTVKKEESAQKAAEPAAVTQPQEKAISKEEAPAPAPVKEEQVAEQPVKEAAAAKEAQAEAKDEVSQMAETQGKLLTVYFDFDRFTIRDDMKPVLEKDVAWLKKNSGVKIEIQGHCDERGTAEYNIALGERRAQSIKKYLINAGIGGARLSTISFGKEKPADPRHNEEAWAKNRRGEFVVK